ncbi:hypothetical protein AB1N83_011773 [Pleurotus pulmonarius]
MDVASVDMGTGPHCTSSIHGSRGAATVRCATKRNPRVLSRKSNFGFEHLPMTAVASLELEETIGTYDIQQSRAKLAPPRTTAHHLRRPHYLLVQHCFPQRQCQERSLL